MIFLTLLFGCMDTRNCNISQNRKHLYLAEHITDVLKSLSGSTEGWVST